MPDEPVTLFGRLRLTAHVTVFHVPKLFGLRQVGDKPLCRGIADAEAYMRARDADAAKRNVLLYRDPTVAECASYFAAPSCPKCLAKVAWRVVKRKHRHRPPKRSPRAKDAKRLISHIPAKDR
jgi:hypothetical protein